MENLKRYPCQGVLNVLRFNWPYYMLPFILLAIYPFAGSFKGLWLLAVALGMAGAIMSLAASYIVYDKSGLYELNWLDKIPMNPTAKILNFHAGLDEFSGPLANKLGCGIVSYDFYDPKRHPEKSIARARNAYKAQSSVSVNTGDLKLSENSAGVIFVLFAAHEIRNLQERIQFFRQLNASLMPGGKVIVAEHLRDLPNFLAYNAGFFHFLSRKTWLQTFRESGLCIQESRKHTPFVIIFTLVKDGDAN